MTASTATPDVVESRRVVDEFMAAMNRMDVDAVGALLTDDATWTMPGDLPVSGRHEGRDAVLGDFLANAAALFEPGSLRFELETVIAGQLLRENAAVVQGCVPFVSLKGDSYRLRGKD